MKLWNAVKTIDSRYTKEASVKGQRITSFSLQSVVMMATEQFGKFGKGWGYEVEQERFDEGVIIQPGATHDNGDVTPEVKSVTHTLLIRLWYMDGEDKVICPIQAGHTPYISRTKYGPSHDDEYYKKTLADGIKKSLSMLGFGADIFLGLMDDQSYQQVMMEEKALKDSAELPRKIEEFGKRVSQWCQDYSSNTMSHSIKAMYQNHCNMVHSECRKLNIPAEKYLEKLKNAADERIAQLMKQSQQGNK